MPSPTNGNDKLIYGDDDDRFDALGGNDIVYAGAGADFFSGGVGKDRLYGEAGSDVIYGGADSDKIYGGDGDDFLNGGSEGEFTDQGDDEIHGGNGDDVAFGGGGKDKLFGDAGYDQLSGGDGKDTLYGGEGNDELNGDAGNDRLYGEVGNDRMSGGAGDDQIFGGAGNDRMYGDDIFGTPGGNDRLDGGEGIDYALFSGNFADYRITTNADGVTIIQDLRQSESGFDNFDGKDSLTNIERLVFEDKTISLSNPDLDATFAGANAIGTADLADGSFTANASLDLPDDVDIWRVSLTAGQTVTAFTTADMVNQPRTNIAVYDASGQFLDINWDDNQDDPDEGYPDLNLTFTAQETGDYYFAVAGYAHVPTRDDDPNGPNYTGFSDHSGDYIFNLTA
jgi:Ca2+-binding RTX toxin-like protein